MPSTDHSQAQTVRELAAALGRAPTRSEQTELLWAMSAQEREAAMYRGQLTQYQCFAWAQRCPAEVPRLHGEFWFIAAATPEVAEHTRR